MMIRIQHTRPDGEVDTYHLKPGRRYHIGRGSVCEIRILDLKLSRKHCVVEFVGDHWQVEDLMSTNVCRVNGEQIVGKVPVKMGATIDICQSNLRISAMPEGAIEPTPMSSSAVHDKIAAADPMAITTEAPSELDEEPVKVEQEEMPEVANQVRTDSELRANDWEPEPVAAAVHKSCALVPMGKSADDSSSAHAAVPPSARANTAAVKPVVIRPPDAADSEATTSNEPVTSPFTLDDLPAAKAEPAPVAKEPAELEPSGFVAALPESEPRPAGRVKPVTIRVGSQESKAAQQAAAIAAPPASPSSSSGTGDDRTFFITVLGKRVGPLARADARELKARELKGTMSLADLDKYPKA